MHAAVTEYKGNLVFQLLTNHSIPGEVKASQDNPGCQGQTIHDTGRNLGISKEALSLLEEVPRGTDPVGDVYWKPGKGGKGVFAWRGEAVVTRPGSCCVGSATFGILDFVLISNDAVELPAMTKEILDTFCAEAH